MDNLQMNIYFCVGIVLAFVFNNHREWLGGRPANPDDDGSESLLWFFICSGFWPLMLTAVAFAKARKSLQQQH